MRNPITMCLWMLSAMTLSHAQSDTFKSSDIPAFQNESYESQIKQQYLKKHPSIQKTADLESLRIINSNYAVDAQFAYYGGQRIQGADPLTLRAYKFSSAYNDYAMDANHVYSEGEILPLAEPHNFNALGYSSRNRYAIDDHYVYFNNDLIRGADPKSFIFGPEGFAQDQTAIYYGKDPLTNSDARTFRFLDKDSYSSRGYAADLNQVYYFPKTLEGADPQTFHIIDENIAKDKNAVYFRENQLTEVKDPQSFQLLHSYYRDHGIFKDRYHIYYLRHGDFYPITDADLATFEVLPSPYDNFGKDKNHVYTMDSSGYRIFDQLDPRSTQLKGPFVLDGQNLYNKRSSWNEKDTNNKDWAKYRIPLNNYELIEFIDLPSFQHLGGPYAMDKEIVFMGLGYTLEVLGKRSELRPEVIRQRTAPKHLIKIGDQCFNINMGKNPCP